MINKSYLEVHDADVYIIILYGTLHGNRPTLKWLITHSMVVW